VQHNKAMAIMKLMTLYQEKFQDIQEFRDQYLAIRKVCNELDISFGRCKDDAKAMLVKEGIIEPTTAQLKNAMDKVEEELHAIIFMYKMDKSRYGRIIEEKENDVLEEKDTFLKTVANACWVLSGWKNKYGNKGTRLTEANDGVEFATMGNEEKKGNKKKEITCYKCGKSGHYLNKCDEENTVKTSNASNSGKKGSKYLMLKKDVDDSSSEDDDEAVSTSSDDEESKMFNCGEKELPYKENDDDNDDDEETDEENNDRDEDTDDDDCDEYTDTDDDYEGFAFLQNNVMCSLKDKAGIPTS